MPAIREWAAWAAILGVCTLGCRSDDESKSPGKAVSEVPSALPCLERAALIDGVVLELGGAEWLRRLWQSMGIVNDANAGYWEGRVAELEQGIRARLMRNPEISDAVLKEALESLRKHGGKHVADVKRALDDAIVGELRSMTGQGEFAHPSTDLGRREHLAQKVLRDVYRAQVGFHQGTLVDADKDGVGEFGTGLELAGAWGLRSGLRTNSETGLAESGFWNVRGWTSGPAVLSMQPRVSALGTLVESGYVFQVFLPDSGMPPEWTHPCVSGGQLIIQGNKGAIGVDASERWWCAYAVPEEFGVTGKCAYFIDWRGVVLGSSNEHRRWQGEDWIDPTSAYLGDGVDSEIADDRTGLDGELWTKGE